MRWKVAVSRSKKLSNYFQKFAGAAKGVRGNRIKTGADVNTGCLRVRFFCGPLHSPPGQRGGETGLRQGARRMQEVRRKASERETEKNFGRGLEEIKKLLTFAARFREEAS